MARSKSIELYADFLRRNRPLARAADTILAGVGEFANLKTQEDFTKIIAEFRAESGESTNRATVRELIDKHLRPGRLDPASLRRLSFVCRAAEVALNQSPWHHQVVCALLLHRGTIVQLPNGCGKTLAIGLASGFNGLLGKATHIATSNDYLAERDVRFLGPFYRLLGLSVGVIFTAQSVRFERGILEPDSITLRVAQKFNEPATGELSTSSDAGAANETQLALPFALDDVLKAQSERIAALRETISSVENPKEIVFQWLLPFVQRSVTARFERRWDLETLRTEIRHQFGADLDLTSFALAAPDALETYIFHSLEIKYQEKEDLVGSEVMRQTERIIIGQVIENQWTSYQQVLRDFTREFGTRTSGQTDTLREYQESV
jgi:preprotein translocase subunit SecA